ncbi:MAG: outer membrane protein W [Candidatus Azotimanducaceae bacterium]|jgi:outer membrane protein W
MIDDNWLVNGSIWYTDISTEAKINTSLADVKFDPMVYMLPIGYRV